MPPGVAVLDFDGDGREDLFVPGGDGNRLYRNRGDGTYEDVAAKAGVAGQEGEAIGALAFDYDNDGWPDLYVTYLFRPNLLYRNRGDGTFEEVGEEGRRRVERLLHVRRRARLRPRRTAGPLRPRLRAARTADPTSRRTTRRPITSSATTATARSPTCRRRRGRTTPAGVSRSSPRTSTATAGPTSTSPTTSATTPTSATTATAPSRTSAERRASSTPASAWASPWTTTTATGASTSTSRTIRSRYNWFLRDPRYPMPEFPYSLGRPLVWRRLKAPLARLLALPQRSAAAASSGRRTRPASGTPPGPGAAVFVDADMDGRPDLFVVNGMVTGKNPKEREIDFWNLMSAEYKKFEKGIPTGDFGDDSLWGRAAQALLQEPRRTTLRRARGGHRPRVRRQPARPRRHRRQRRRRPGPLRHRLPPASLALDQPQPLAREVARRHAPGRSRRSRPATARRATRSAPS